MEPVTALFAGAAAFYALHRAEKRRDRELNGPGTLPAVLAADACGESASISVIAIRLQHLELCPRLAGMQLKARVKYGRGLESIMCDSEEVAVPAPLCSLDGSSSMSSVNCNTTTLFLEHHRFKPVIRICLKLPGRFGRTVARAELKFTPVCHRRPKVRELRLQGAGILAGKSLGRVEVAISGYSVPKGELREVLATADVQHRKHSFVAGGLDPVEQGVVLSSEADSDEEDLVRGEPMACVFRSPARRVAA